MHCFFSPSSDLFTLLTLHFSYPVDPTSNPSQHTTRPMHQHSLPGPQLCSGWPQDPARSSHPLPRWHPPSPEPDSESTSSREAWVPRDEWGASQPLPLCGPFKVKHLSAEFPGLSPQAVSSQGQLSIFLTCVPVSPPPPTVPWASGTQDPSISLCREKERAALMHQIWLCRHREGIYTLSWAPRPTSKEARGWGWVHGETDGAS